VQSTAQELRHTRQIAMTAQGELLSESSARRVAEQKVQSLSTDLQATTKKATNLEKKVVAAE
jgi:hypothetical protein